MDPTTPDEMAQDQKLPTDLLAALVKEGGRSTLLEIFAVRLAAEALQLRRETVHNQEVVCLLQEDNVKLNLRIGSLKEERDAARKEAAENMDGWRSAQRSANRFYNAIVDRLQPFFSADSRDLEWDVLPSTLATLARENQSLREAKAQTEIHAHE